MSKISELRKAAGLSQVELAALVGVTPNTVQGWETKGSADQTITKFLKLCAILDCSLHDLIESPAQPRPGELFTFAELEKRFQKPRE